MRTLMWLVLATSLACGPTQENVEKVPEPPKTIPMEIAEAGEEKEAPSPVYYRQTNINALTPVPIHLVRHPDPAVMAKHLIDLLSIQPETPGFEAIWPSNTFVREVYLLNEGTIVVDFDQGFVSSLSAGTTLEEEMVVSLVLTLLDNFGTYQRVRILVGGNPQETFLGHVDIESTLDRATKVYTVIPEQDPNEDIVVENLDDDQSANKN